ncbi:MAG: DUF116 domain-containing protein, partial [Thiohalobacteraceae bacterium]
RKLASLFSSRHRSTFLLQGWLLLSADVGRVLGTLRLATEPAPGDQGPVAARERLTALDGLFRRPPPPARLRKALAATLASQFNLRAASSTKTIYAQLHGASPPPWAALAYAPRIPTATLHWRTQATRMTEVAETLGHTPGGLLRARLRWDPLQRAPAWLELGGNVSVQPPDLFARLGAALVGVNKTALAERLDLLCNQMKARLIGFSREDLLDLLESAWERPEQQRNFGLSTAQSNRLMLVNLSGSATDTTTAIRRSDTMLVPYCARPPACREKPLDACSTCHDCEVGSACRTANEQGLGIREMTRYADLARLLAQLRAEGSTGIVGMTCQTFFIKHHALFAAAGLPMVLIDLGGTTCYELQQESAGYSGAFPYQTRLDVQVLRKLVQVRPPAEQARAALG